MNDTTHNGAADGPSATNDRSEIRLTDYWRVLVQRRNTVFASLGAGLVLAVLATTLAVPRYQASTTLQISRQSPNVTTFKDVLAVDPAGYLDFYQTQFRIIQSRAVMRLAAEKMDLASRPEFAGRKGSPVGRLKSWVGGLFASRRLDLDEPSDPLDPAIRFLTAGMSVQPIRNSQLVRLDFTDRDPKLAAEAANAVAGAYEEFNLRARYDTTSQAADFLTKEVARIQADVAAAERRLQEYSTKTEVLSVGGLKDITEQALADLNTRLTEARGRLALAEARWRSAQSSAPDALPEVLESPLISRLREEYARTERDHSRMAERFKADWPPLQELTESLDKSRERLSIEIDGIATQVRQVARADYERARGEVANLQEQVDSQKSAVQKVNRDNIEFASLRAEIDTKRKVLADLVARQSETQTSERLKDTQTSNVRVVDLAEAPKYPVSPRKLLNLLMGLFLGGGVGVVLAFALDHLDNTVKSEDDVTRLTGLPALGHVPLYHPLRAVGEDGVPPAGGLDAIDVASHLDPKSLFAEAFKNLRTSILLASPERPPKSVAVTSFEPGDGKSIVGLNLAIVFTQMGRRVLLVDADLRRPRVHKMLGLPNDAGLSSVLSGNATLEAAVHETVIPNLYVITSGPVPPNPSELLGSRGLDTFLEAITEEGAYDLVVFDSPPALQVTDPVILSTKVEATLLVVRGGKTARESLVQGVARLRQARGRGRIVGAILNAVTEGQGYYYGKYGYYHHQEEPRAARPLSVAGRLRARGRRAGQA